MYLGAMSVPAEIVEGHGKILISLALSAISFVDSLCTHYVLIIP